MYVSTDGDHRFLKIGGRENTHYDLRAWIEGKPGYDEEHSMTMQKETIPHSALGQIIPTKRS